MVFRVVAGRLTQSVTQHEGRVRFSLTGEADSPIFVRTKIGTVAIRKWGSSHAADGEEANASRARCYARR